MKNFGSTLDKLQPKLFQLFPIQKSVLVSSITYYLGIFIVTGDHIQGSGLQDNYSKPRLIITDDNSQMLLYPFFSTISFP